MSQKLRKLIPISTRKLVVLLCITAISLGSLVFAATSFMNKSFTNSQPNRNDEFAANLVKIYGNGVTFVSYEETVALSENSMIQFYLPSGAITDTLTVEGISIVKIVISEESHAILERGDIITVYTEDSVYTGKFLGWNDMLLLEVNNGTIMIPGARITKLALTEVVQTQGPKILVQVTADSDPGEYKLKVSYLMRGPKWKAAYFIDVETSDLECWATIENVENWNDVTLVLVNGGPHLVYRGPIYSPAEFFLGARSTSLSIDFSSSTMDEYHEYTYGREMSFQKGTVVRLPLFDGMVTLRQEYFWQGGEVQNRYHINNTLSEPLAAGVVEFYRGQAWIGEDSIPYTPVKAESIAIANYAYDIKVSSVVTKAIDQNNYALHGINLTIRNHKTTAVQVLVHQDIGGHTLLASDPPATRVGGMISWIVDIDADGTAKLYYEWEHHW